MRRAAFFLREYFFPCGCAVCGAALGGMEEPWFGICETCRRRIVADCAESGAEKRCDCCGKPLISEQERCLPCRNGAERAFDRIIVFFPYTGIYRRLLRAYKFGKSVAVGNFFAEHIRAALDTLAGGGGVSVVPVPPRPGKIKKAGWDQVEYLAGLLERGNGGGGNWRVLRCLKRLPSGVQKKLNREDRQKNLRGRIRLTMPAPTTAVLIDDVMTTGSTMDACAAALKAGGTERVYGICLFYD
jgi:ComF family protein